eukprot:scaffold24490_cov60-Phaeocystis_antarctica.AAC.5
MSPTSLMSLACLSEPAIAITFQSSCQVRGAVGGGFPSSKRGRDWATKGAASVGVLSTRGVCGPRRAWSGVRRRRPSISVCRGVQRCVQREGAHLAVVDHREHAERLDRHDGAHVLRRGANLHHVDRVVVAEGTAHVGVALDVRVLPRLRQAAVVPEDGAVVQARLALLLVLHDRVALDLGRDLPRGSMRAWHPSATAAIPGTAAVDRSA